MAFFDQGIELTTSYKRILSSTLGATFMLYCTATDSQAFYFRSEGNSGVTLVPSDQALEYRESVENGSVHEEFRAEP